MISIFNPKITSDSEGRKVYFLSLQQANIFAITLLVPLILFIALPYYLVWGDNIFNELKFKPFLFLILFIVVGVLIHELLHGVVWAVFSQNGFKSINFGIRWDYLAPYCHCSTSLRVWQYILGAIAPLILMGIIPSLLAFISGNTLLMFFGLFYIWTAAGDILSVKLLSKFRYNQWVIDHPQELGVIVENGK